MDRPILMSASMVHAVIGGTKTQTRRVLKIDADSVEPHEKFPGEFSPWKNGEKLPTILCPYGSAGDRLWVRETGWQRMGASGTFDPYYYDASVTADVATWLKERPHVFRRRPSIHMPRAASRITLKITDVRVAHLQEISPGDAEAEGWPGPDAENTIRNAYPIAWYSHLWDQINGKTAPWASNPWVWVLGFEVVK